MIRGVLLFLLLSGPPCLAADAGYCVNQCGNRCYKSTSPSCFSACTNSCMSGGPRLGGGGGGSPGPRWGAVAGEVPPGNAFGVSNGHGSEGQARAMAMAQCRKYSAGYACGVLMAFPTPLCVGLATGWDGDASQGLFVHTDRNRRVAEQAAVNDCRDRLSKARCELREPATCAAD